MSKVTVRWIDGYLEEFEASKVIVVFDLLSIRSEKGRSRHIPLRQVRWFELEKSH